MAVRRQISRYENKATEVADKLFFNTSLSRGTMASMRQSAKRFVTTPEFITNCLYYEGELINGRWRFKPVGVGQSFIKETEAAEA